MTNDDDAFERQEPETRDGSDETTRERNDAGGLERRQLLGAVASTGAVSLAGCTVTSDGIEISFDDGTSGGSAGAGTNPTSGDSAGGPDTGNGQAATDDADATTAEPADGDQSQSTEPSSSTENPSDGSQQAADGDGAGDPGEDPDADADDEDDPDPDSDEKSDPDESETEADEDEEESVDDEDEAESADDEETDEDEDEDEDEDATDDTVIGSIRLHDFELTATGLSTTTDETPWDGDTAVEGDISILGEYDGGEVTPSGHTDSHVWYDDHKLYDGDSEPIDLGVTVRFPDDALEDIEQSTPSVHVKAGFFSYTGGDTDIDDTRIFLEAGSDATYDDQELTFYTGGAETLTLTFSVSPLDLSLQEPIDGDLRELDGDIPTMF